MKFFCLLSLFYAAHAFKLSDFSGVPAELLSLHNDTDADDMGMVETFVNVASTVANAIDEKSNNKEITDQDRVIIDGFVEESGISEKVMDVEEGNISDVVDNKVEQIKDIEDEEDEVKEAVEKMAKEEKQTKTKEIVNQQSYLEEEAKYLAAKELVKQEVYLEEESKYFADPDGCPLDSKNVFQMKLYWEKGTEWQGSMKEKAWYAMLVISHLLYITFILTFIQNRCAECEDDCDSGEQVRIKECDEDEKEQFWIFDKCSVKPARNPNVCMTTGVDKKKRGNEGVIELRTCNEERETQQKFRLFDPKDIFEKFQFKLLSKEGKNNRICLSQEHHPR